MKKRKTTFAVLVGNRGFFPESLIAAARDEVRATLTALGHDVLMLPADATRYGAVETPAEGAAFAKMVRDHADVCDGIVITLPNFGDENGAIEAVRDAGLPILVQAYPDDLDKMAPEHRRDAFCGKISIMDILCQHRIPFTSLPPHTSHPSSKTFAAQIDHFARVCRVVRGLRRMRVGAIGARTSAFKTVRIDELTLQKLGITMETFDLSCVLAQMAEVPASALKQKSHTLQSISDCSAVPEKSLDQLARLGVVLDRIIEENALDAIAMRCWIELQQIAGISPCVLLGHINERGGIASCEVDVGNAIAMHALSLATANPAACLDWNNNYTDDPDKCILFHCGPVPMSMMTARGCIEDHAILAHGIGEGRSFGCNVGRIRPMPMTFSSLATRDGELVGYVGCGEFTNDPIPRDFFGCAGVAQIDRLQDVLLHVGTAGHRHHVSVSEGHVVAPLIEAMSHYLNYTITRV
jgi:L-fucose isomerase-like protein